MIFYIPDIDSKKIEGEPLKHFISMRKDKGDILEATDFNGNKARIELIFISKKNDLAEFRILGKWKEESELKNILIQSITDRNYQEKLAEIIPHAKVKKLIFCKTEYSSPQTPKLDRLEKILIRSCEQAELSYKPEIEISKKSLKELIQEFNPVVLDFEDETKNSELKPNLSRDPLASMNEREKNQNSTPAAGKDLSFPHSGQNPNAKLYGGILNQVQDDSGNKEISNIQSQNYKNTQNTILVGPEGGFSEDEKKLFKKLSCQIKSLGKIIFPAWLAGFSYFQRIEK